MEKIEPLLVRGRSALLGEELQEVERPALEVQDGVIVRCGTASEITPEPGTLVLDVDDLTLLPGFIDAHVHIGFVDPVDVATGGVTTVRDLGWPQQEIAPLVEASRSPGFPGPSIVAAGPIVTAPGGYPTRAGWAATGTGREVTSPEDAARVVGSLAAWGATVIKVALNPPAGPVLSLETLKVIVQEAHSLGLRVTGHVTGLEQLEKALEAGLDELAHMLMGPEAIPDSTIERMVAAGMVVVPTLAVRTGLELDQAVDNLARFVAAGGKVVYGTDLGDEGPKPGIDELEVRRMAAAGMSAAATISSATIDAARWLGLTDRGALLEGRRADIIGVAGNPLRNAEDLLKVRLVVKAGKVLRAP